jgi:hypothetical protein
MPTIRSKRLVGALATLAVFAALAFTATAGAGGSGALVTQGFCSYQNAGDTIEVEIDSTKKQKIETKGGNILITCHFTAPTSLRGRRRSSASPGLSAHCDAARTGASSTRPIATSP